MSDEPVELFIRRRTRPDGRKQAWCRDCGCEIIATTESLRKEFRGGYVSCKACTPRLSGSYGGSPQDSHDMAYHGGQFYRGEW